MSGLIPLFLLIIATAFTTKAHAETNLANPSFDMEVGFGERLSESTIAFACQGTLVYREKNPNGGWKCAMATAAHCVRFSNEPMTFLRIKPYGFIRADRVEAKIASETPSPRQDMALIFFREGCEQMESRLVEIYSPEKRGEALERGTDLLSASRAHSTLLATRLKQGWNFDPDISVVVSIMTRKAVHPGDSGGGIFIKSPRTKKLELLAVLSGAWVDRKVAASFDRIGGFTVGASGDTGWLKAQLRGPGGGLAPALAPSTAETAVRDQFDLMNQFLSPGER